MALAYPGTPVDYWLTTHDDRLIATAIDLLDREGDEDADTSD